MENGRCSRQIEGEAWNDVIETNGKVDSGKSNEVREAKGKELAVILSCYFP